MSERAPIRVARVAGGPLTYLIDTTPQALPPVRSTDLAEAWSSAREAAHDGRWSLPRLLRFLRADGGVLDLALADADACCWAGAVDQSTGMHTTYGMSLCLRLLALVDLLARASWLRRFYRLGRAGAALDPALLRVAAAATLTEQARFDEGQFRAHLAAVAPPNLMISGATS
jgi:hypothetical protein